MARPKKDSPIDLSITHELSVGLIERLTCPPTTPKAFLRDKDVTGLRVRVTANGVKSFVYEAKLNGKAISRTLGGFPLMSIDEAKDKARELAKTVKTDKQDPRELDRKQREAAAVAKAQQDAETAAAEQAASAAALTVAEVWSAYIDERRPHWGDLHYRDHIDKAKPGGLPSGRRGGGKQLTRPGPLAALMPLPLKDLDQPTIEAWAANEGKTRASSARLAWRLLTVFLTWCAEQPAYAALLPVKNPAKTKKAREALGKSGVKRDVLQKGQLKAWFAAIQQLQNPVISACPQILLLTGARLNEVMGMRWEDINTKWKGISINDKVDGRREIPLTPYVEHLLSALPRRSEWVFSSARVLKMDDHNIHRRETKATKRGTIAPVGEVLETSETGRIAEPNTAHTRACRAAGLEGLTLHGLRRSFKSLTEWLEVPVGVVAQIQGHKPSATAEKHYTVRPLELLAMHHNKIEAWILAQAEIVFDAEAKPRKPRAVAI